MSIGRTVKRLRKAAGIKTQREFAERMQVPQSRASDLETDRYGLPDTRTLLTAAKTIGCSIDEILDGFEGYKRRDLVRHGTDQASTAEVGGSAVDATTRLLKDRDARIQTLEARLATAQTLARSLVDTLADGGKSRTTPKPQSGGGRRRGTAD